MVARDPGAAESATIGTWTCAILGVVAFLLAFLAPVGSAGFWALLVPGLLVALLSGYATWALARGRTGIAWASAANVAIGAWLLVEPYLVSDSLPAAGAGFALGLLIVLVAGFNARSAALARRRVPVRPG